jgi:hypothetical protein
MSKRTVLAAGAAIAALAVTGCGGSPSPRSSQPAKAANPNAPEQNPAGDIPDNQAYVRYAPSGAGFSVRVPEGWSRSAAGRAVVFTDKLNAVRIETAPAAAVSASAVKRTDLPKLAASIKGYKAEGVSTVTRKAGQAVRIKYLATAKPSAVTGKTGQDAVERYLFVHKGRELILTLSGPKGADNVDPWMIITNSVAWS